MVDEEEIEKTVAVYSAPTIPVSGGGDVEFVPMEVVDGSPSTKTPNDVDRFRQRFGESPFPLTADKLMRFCRYDYVGQWQLGAFYPAVLAKECALLLPRPVWGCDDPALTVLLDTWNCNFLFFRCRAIGDVLACYEMMRWRNADRKI